MNLCQNHLHSLRQNHLYSLWQNIHQNLQHLHHQKKPHRSGSKRHSTGLIKQKNYHRSTSHSPVSKRDKKSPGRKHEERKILGVGHLKSLKEAKKENAVYSRDQDHQKGKNTREVVRDL